MNYAFPGDIYNKIEQLLITREITDKLNAYAYGCDEPDIDALKNCFHAESRHIRGSFDGYSCDYIDLIIRQRAELAYSSHHVCNIVVKLDGRRAVSSSRFSCHQRKGLAKGAMDRFVRGRWLDRWENRDGIWRIFDRLGIHDLDFTLPAPDDGALPDERCTVPQGQYRSFDD